MEGSYSRDSVQELDKDIDRLAIQARAVQAVEGDLLKKAGLRSRDKILEMGCGPGFITNVLAQSSPEGQILSVDYSIDLLKQFKNNVNIYPVDGVYEVCASASNLPLRDQSRDFVYARFLMQHVPDPLPLIEEGKRVLAENGTFCIVDSDDSLILHYPENKKIQNFLSQAEKIQSERGGNRFVGKRLSCLMRQAGLKDIDCQIIMFTTSQIPFEMLFNIIFGYKAKLVQQDQEMKSLFSELKQSIEKGEFMLAAGVFLVTARK